MGFNPAEKRGPDGKWIKVGGTMVKLLRASDLSTPDARRSPEVSAEQFAKHAEAGRAKLDRLKGTGFAANGLKNGKAWDKVLADAFTATREPWGGVTVDAHTGEHVAADADKYALTMRDPGMESVHVDPKAGQGDFNKAMGVARERYKAILRRPGSHLGVFRDEDTGNIDIDPVLVTPNLKDVHDIGAYTGAVGGAYHFKSGDGYWPPHVVEKAKEPAMSLSFNTPSVHSTEFDLAHEDGRLAFWKQILPKKSIHYTAKDGSRQQIDFTDDYLKDLANNKAVDKVGFLLADKDNGHTMDPERWRGEVTQMEVRDDGLYGKIVFPSAEAAKAVLDNPELGVSARIREGVARSDGSTLNRGIIHVLGTLDPQVSGMSPWQTADLSTESDVLDLSDEEYEDMAKKKALDEYSEADIDAMTDEELDAFLTEFVPDFENYTDEADDADEDESDEDEANEDAEAKEKALVGAGADMSNKDTSDVDLANQRAEAATARANEALKRVAEAEWREERSGYLSEGVPPHALDLAAPVLNRADDMVIDLSFADEADVNVSEVVRGLLDSLKGTVDLSVEEGHSGTFRAGDGEDPDKALLDRWNSEF